MSSSARLGHLRSFHEIFNLKLGITEAGFQWHNDNNNNFIETRLQGTISK